MVSELVISADCHAMCDPRDIAQYMPLQMQEAYLLESARATEILNDPANAIFSKELREKFVANQEVRGETSFTSTRGQSNSEIRMAELLADGIIAEVVYPNAPNLTPLGELSAAQLQTEAEKAYNRWLVEFCALAPDRRAGLAILNLEDIASAVKEVEYAAAHNLKGVIIPTAPKRGGSLYYDKSYESLWAICEETGLSLHVHGGTGGPDYGASSAGAITLLTEITYWAQRPLWWLIWGGVFERHPKLNLVITESLCFWVPSVLQYLDHLYTGPVGGDIRGQLKLKPSEYWQRQCHVVCSPLYQNDIRLRHSIGVKSMMWGSDYPHVEGTWPNSRESLAQAFKGVPDSDAQAILLNNPARLYGFDLMALCPDVTPNRIPEKRL